MTKDDRNLNFQLVAHPKPLPFLYQNSIQVSAVWQNRSFSGLAEGQSLKLNNKVTKIQRYHPLNRNHAVEFRRAADNAT
jgi:hypothetical protein